ncbi:hypothetical protein KCV07_g6128, partial [Aureobasidium melanogenum]
HSQLKTGHPVRSAIHKQLNGRLVLRWVTTWESLLLYVLLLEHIFFDSILSSPRSGRNRPLCTATQETVRSSQRDPGTQSFTPAWQTETHEYAAFDFSTLRTSMLIAE